MDIEESSFADFVRLLGLAQKCRDKLVPAIVVVSCTESSDHVSGVAPGIILPALLTIPALMPSSSQHSGACSALVSDGIIHRIS